MGNTCCAAKEESNYDLNTYITLSTNSSNRSELLSNMKKYKEGEFLEHAPQPQIAIEVSKMNVLPKKTSTIYHSTKSEKIKLPKKNIKQFETLPFLGPFKYQDMSTYEGQYLNGFRHGFGKQTWTDGAIYEGFWKNDHCSGKGKLINSEGNVYLGDWVDDKAEGYGEFTNMDGTVYVGDWVDDQQHGKGHEIWADGSEYVGMYKNSLKHGKGMFQWADGPTYEGNFFQNNISGFGIFFV